MNAGLYIHIPFCVKKCAYCDFLSFPCGKETREIYVKALIREIQAYKSNQDYEVPTIFIGGGTPSVLDKGQLERILAALYESFAVKEDAEVTMEMNPGSMNTGHFVIPSHINRVSIGLQSANNTELKKLGRIHTFEEFLRTYEQVRNSGIHSVNVDLISAIPDQNLQSWEYTLTTVAKLGPEHISAYSLIVEEGTPFYEMELNLPSEDEERLIYQRTEKILDSYGYRQYEISNYAKPGYECRHNSSYWRRDNYLGFGLGASSLLDNRRYHNTASMEQYLKYSGRPDKIREDMENLTLQAQMEEFMFLGLRMTEGVSRREFQKQFGLEMDRVYAEPLRRMREENLLEIEEDSVCLTKRGIDISNYVMSNFILG